MKATRAATATVASMPSGSPQLAMNTASRTPAPAGTGTARKPAIHDSTAAKPTRASPASGVRARAVAQVAVPMNSHVGDVAQDQAHRGPPAGHDDLHVAPKHPPGQSLHHRQGPGVQQPQPDREQEQDQQRPVYALPSGRHHEHRTAATNMAAR